jgi:CBS domain-containing protein
MSKARELFEAHLFHHLPVVEDDQVVGIISKSDYAKLLHGFTLFQTRSSETYNEAVFRSILVGEVMSSPVITLNPDDTLELAARIFRENLFHALPVVDKKSHLLGMLTPYDLLEYVFSDPPELLENKEEASRES